MELKENYCYVHISQESAPYYRIGLMSYSIKEGSEEVKSFLFSFNYTSKEGIRSLGENKDVLIEHTKLKILFGSINTDEPAGKDTLGGKGGTRFTDSNGDYVFGYIFSSVSGQKALDWFAEKSSHMPTIDELKEGIEDKMEEVRAKLKKLAKKKGSDEEESEEEKSSKKKKEESEEEEKPKKESGKIYWVPPDMSTAKKSQRNIYLRQYSSHDHEELAAIINVKEKKTASKYQSAPKLVKDVPISKNSLPSQKKVAGIPTSRKGAEESKKSSSKKGDTPKKKKPISLDSDSEEDKPKKKKQESDSEADDQLKPDKSQDRIQKAIDIIFKAILDGDITEESEFGYLLEDKKGKIGLGEGTPKSRIYQGFAGIRKTVQKSVNAVTEEYNEDNYETAVIEPSLAFKIVTRLEKAKS